jgi:drug/metabolite transporter (DMT)-like permease
LSAEEQRIHVKTRLLALVVILSNVLGNTALSLGMKQRPGFTLAPAAVLETIFSPWVGLGIVLLVLWLLLRMALLSWADLSYVLPVTSVGYVLSAFVGRFVFAEHITWQRWTGTFLIFGGMMLVGGTRPNTTLDRAHASEALVVGGSV